MNRLIAIIILVAGLAFAIDEVTIKYGANKARVNANGQLVTDAVISVGTVTVSGIAYGETILKDEEGDKVDVSKKREMIISERLIKPVLLTSSSISPTGSQSVAYTAIGSTTVTGLNIGAFIENNKAGGEIVFNILIGSYELFAISTPTNPFVFLDLKSGIEIADGSEIKITGWNNENINQIFKVNILIK
ncbi:MAG: hypothetical protein ACOYWZ_08740 [Bacillota bacterium]